MDATKASWGCPPALPTHSDKVSQRNPKKSKTAWTTEIQNRQVANWSTEQGGQRSQANSEAYSPDGSDKVSQSTRTRICVRKGQAASVCLL